MAEDARVEGIVQRDDLVMPFGDAEEQPVIPRLPEPFQVDVEGRRLRHHSANVLREGVSTDRSRDREDHREVRLDEMGGRIVGPPE